MSQELELFGQFLIRLRQSKLQQAHNRSLAAEVTLLEIKTLAHEAELCIRISSALKELNDDPGGFVRSYLQ